MATCGQLKCLQIEICSFLKIIGLQTVQTLIWSYYNHKSIPDAKFEADSSSSFGDKTSQNFNWKKAMSHQIMLFIPRDCKFESY